MPKVKSKATVSGNPGGKSPAATKTRPKKPARVDHSGGSREHAPLLSGRFPGMEEQEITLTIFAPQAREVKLAGNFNDWNPDVAPLKNRGQGEWVARLKLRAGQYEYRFVVDGEWIADPGTSHTRPNPFGGLNSVLTVPLARGAALHGEGDKVVVLDLQQDGERAYQCGQ